MPGEYQHWPTGQATRDSNMIYSNTGSKWIVQAMASDFHIEMDDHVFMIGEQKELSAFLINEGSTDAHSPIFTIQIDRRFSYISGSAYCVGYENVDPIIERCESNGLYIEFPDSVVIPAGDKLEIRFPVAAA